MKKTTLRQIVIDYTYATDYMAPGNKRLAEVREAAAKAIPSLIGRPDGPLKARPSWETNKDATSRKT
jgi:hypothetical protein